MDFGFENQNPYPLFSLKQRKAVKYNHRKKQMISAEKEKSKCNIKNKIQTRKAIARFGKEFGSYKLVEVPYPTCGPEDIILEIKAAAICGTDMKHWNYEQPLEKAFW